MQLFSTVSVQYCNSWHKDLISLLRKVRERKRERVCINKLSLLEEVFAHNKKKLRSQNSRESGNVVVINSFIKYVHRMTRANGMY